MMEIDENRDPIYAKTGPSWSGMSNAKKSVGMRLAFGLNPNPTKISNAKAKRWISLQLG